MKKRIDVEQIIAFLGSDLLHIYGDTKNVFIDNLADVENTNITTLDWVNPSSANQQKMAELSKALVIIVGPHVEYNNVMIKNKKVLLVVTNPKKQLARIGCHFFVDKMSAAIHSTAIVHEDARIGANAYIGPYCIIGKVIIGDDCIIDSNVRIHDGVKIGNGCKIKSGAVLGGEGFGFEKGNDGNLFRFPQLGRLLIGNYVEIGVNTAIDRGSLSDTIIGDHTKINNLCHIAHNNRIGKNVVITGCVNLSGSNLIEDYVWIGPNSSIRGWIHIAEGSTLGAGTVVTKNIPANETWVGNPARKLEKR